MLHGLRPGVQPGLWRRRPHTFDVTQRQVQRQGIQTGFQLDRTHRQHGGHDARVASLQARGEAAEQGDRGGYRRHAQTATRVAGLALQLLLQAFVLVQHAVGAGPHGFALGGKAGIGAPPAHNDDAKFGLQRAQRVGQRRLCDVASLGGAAEVLVFVQRHQVAHRRQQVHAGAKACIRCSC